MAISDNIGVLVELQGFLFDKERDSDEDRISTLEAFKEMHLGNLDILKKLGREMKLLLFYDADQKSIPVIESRLKLEEVRYARLYSNVGNDYKEIKKNAFKYMSEWYDVKYFIDNSGDAIWDSEPKLQKLVVKKH